MNDGFEGQTAGLSYSGLQVSNGNARGWRQGTFNDVGGATATLTSGVGATSISNTELYFSALINADALSNANSVVVAWDHRRVGGFRYQGFEIRGTGDLYSYGGSGNENTDTGLNLAAGTNLLVLRVTDKTSGGLDEYELWLNPTVGSPLGTADYSATFSLGLTSGNGDYGFDSFFMREAFDGAQEVFIDELRLGETALDVLPAIPEPGTLTLVLLSGAGAVLLIRRRGNRID